MTRNGLEKNVMFSSFRIEEHNDHLVLLRGPAKKGMDFSNMLKGYKPFSDETSPEDLIAFIG